MDEINKIIEYTFERKLFDNKSKKQFKALAADLGMKHDDLNYSLKTAFDLIRKSEDKECDLFLVDWLQAVVNAINDLKADIYAVTEVQFSPINDCSSSILNFINSAQKRLYICVFTISDNVITKQIMDKYQKGVEIKIISDNEKQYDKGSDIRQLADAGLNIKLDKSKHHMHHKFAISDDTSLLTGSYNWTRSAAKYNQENLLILKDPFAVRRYLDEFYRLWQTSVNLNV